MKLQKKIEDALKAAGLPGTLWDKLKIEDEADIAGTIEALQSAAQREPGKDQVMTGLKKLVAAGDEDIKTWLTGQVQSVAATQSSQTQTQSSNPAFTLEEDDERPDGGGDSPEKLLENSAFVKQIIDGIQQSVINGILKDGSLPVVSKGVDPDMHSDVRSFAQGKNDHSTSAGFRSSSLGLK